MLPHLKNGWMLPETFPAVKAVYFDLDNTLIDRDTAFRHALPGWLHARVPGLPETQHAAHIAQILMHDGSGRTDRAVFCTWMQSTYSLYGMTVSDIANDLAATIAAYIGRDDAVIRLLALLQQSYRIGVISNGQGKTQRTKLLRAGLDTIFPPESIYIGGECGYEKPDRRIFDLALHDLGLPAGEVLFVGDHPVNDVAGAHAAGMKTCWVNPVSSASGLVPPPDRVVASVNELFSVLHICQV